MTRYGGHGEECSKITTIFESSAAHKMSLSLTTAYFLPTAQPPFSKNEALSTDHAFLRVAIHRSPRQPRQTPPPLVDNPRCRTHTASTLQSRRRRRRRPRIRRDRVTVQVRHNRAHAASAAASRWTRTTWLA